MKASSSVKAQVKSRSWSLKSVVTRFVSASKQEHISKLIEKKSMKPNKDQLVDRMGRPVKHGMHLSPENLAWRHMKDRCYNPNSQRYDRYGARGIRVCRRWRNSFINFYTDVGPRPSPEHSLERKNNDGHYTPKNVIWATRDQQENNKTSNTFLTFRGQRLTLVQWSRKLKIPERTLCNRIESGWSTAKALTTPVEKRIWTKNPGRRLSEETKAAIRVARSTGKSLQKVGDEFGVSASGVQKICRNEVYEAIQCNQAQEEATPGRNLPLLKKKE